MPDSGFNADLSPVHSTTEAATREPRQEGRERRRASKTLKREALEPESATDDAASHQMQNQESAEDPDGTARKLDSFA